MLDLIVAKHHLNRVDAIEVDVKGARDTLARFHEEMARLDFLLEPPLALPMEPTL